MSKSDNSDSTDWVRRGISVDPETDEQFKELIGYDSYSYHVRHLLEAFVKVHEAHRDRGEFIDLNELPDKMADATIEQLDD